MDVSFQVGTYLTLLTSHSRSYTLHNKRGGTIGVARKGFQSGTLTSPQPFIDPENISIQLELGNLGSKTYITLPSYVPRQLACISEATPTKKSISSLDVSRRDWVDGAMPLSPVGILV